MTIDAYLQSHGLTLDAIASTLRLADGDIAYASGSITDGLGDAQSDLDLFVLTSAEGLASRRPLFSDERDIEQRRLNFGIAYVDIGGASFDVEFHMLSDFEELLGLVATVDPTSRDCLWRSFRSLGRFGREEIVDRLHRLRVGVSLHDPERFSALRGRFDERRFRLWSAHFHLIESEDFAKGTRRSLRQADAESAYLKLTRLYDALADALLFLSGDTLDRWKWRLPKLRRLGDQDFLDSYLDVQLHRSQAPSLAAFVESHLEHAGALRDRLHAQLVVS